MCRVKKRQKNLNRRCINCVNKHQKRNKRNNLKDFKTKDDFCVWNRKNAFCRHIFKRFKYVIGCMLLLSLSLFFSLFRSVPIIITYNIYYFVSLILDNKFHHSSFYFWCLCSLEFFHIRGGGFNSYAHNLIQRIKNFHFHIVMHSTLRSCQLSNEKAM